MKKYLLIIFVLFCCSFTFASITNFNVSPSVRLGENLTISGMHSTPNVLCKAVIQDSNNIAVERLSDEYTFADGSFYFERQVLEPPYYRGDDFNAVITCGSDTTSEIFVVLQPLGISHLTEKTWDFVFDQNNLDAMSIVGSFLGLGFILVLIGGFIFKQYN